MQVRSYKVVESGTSHFDVLGQHLDSPGVWVKLQTFDSRADANSWINGVRQRQRELLQGDPPPSHWGK